MAKEKPFTSNELLTETIAELRAQLQICSDRRKDFHKGGFDLALSKAAAAIAGRLKDLIVEQRQQDKHHQKVFDSMTAEEKDELVITYVAALPVERQEQLAKRIAKHGAKGSLLS